VAALSRYTCKDCGAPPEPDRSRCATCARRHAAAEAERREEHKARGRCVVCGKQAQKGRTLCLLHLTYYTTRERKKKGKR
jgi:hypothetical protein